MKKILFATTALVATAGVAAADVSFGGYGRVGVMYVEDAADETFIESRFRLNIDGTTEADNGLSFNARVRIQADDNADGSASAAGLNGANFGMTAGGLNVQVGNIAGAIDSQAGMYNQSLGLTGLGYYNVVANTVTNGFWGFDGYSSGGAGVNGVRVAYGMGGFNLVASHSAEDSGSAPERTAVTGSFDYNNFTVSLGYQESSVDAEDMITAIVQGDFGVANVTFSAAEVNETTKYGIGADFEVGAATTVSAFVNDEEDAGTAYGLGMSHDLGGGASLRGGVVQTPMETTMADFGVLFNF